jgi:hypothetical protein
MIGLVAINLPLFGYMSYMFLFDETKYAKLRKILDSKERVKGRESLWSPLFCCKKK